MHVSEGEGIGIEVVVSNILHAIVTYPEHRTSVALKLKPAIAFHVELLAPLVEDGL